MVNESSHFHKEINIQMNDVLINTPLEVKEKKGLPPIVRALIAAILSVFITGVGHLDTEATVRGFVLFILEFIVGTCVVMTGVLFSKTGLITAILAYLGFKCFVIADAFRVNLRSKRITREKGKGALIFVLFVGMLILTKAVPLKQIARPKAFRISAPSMAPTLLVGDMILTDKKAFAESGPERGDIVVFRYPKDRELNFIKRCVALGGDVVEIRDKELIVNDVPAPTYGAIFMDSKTLSGRDNFGPMTVPPGKIFTIGDNRDNSNDSRFFGTVKVRDVISKARIVYWSWDKINKRVRWERIGKTIQ